MNKWFMQREANITAFLEDDDFLTKRNFFFKMCNAFNEYRIEWNLFCSCSLFFSGITDEFNDFDILIPKSSFEESKSVLKNLGLSVKQEEIYGMQIDKEISKEDASLLERFFEENSNQKFNSNRYANLIGNGVDVDLISGFRVSAMSTRFLYEYNPDFMDCIQIGDSSITIVAPEVQFILYAMMECWQPQRKFKRELIGEYLKDNGIKNPKILENSLRENIPGWIKKEIRLLLNQ